MSNTKVEIKDLNFSYDNNTPVLSGISFQADKNDSIGIIGANGAGKSTLLSLMVGLELDFEGSIIIDGNPVNKKNLSKIRAKTGYVFQDPENQLFMSTIYEDVVFAPRNYGFSETEADHRAIKALEQVGILHLKDKHTYKLSSGEKKLASIAAILSMEPGILLMDEPTTALDPGNRRNLIHLLNGFSQLKLITSHDLDFIWDTCSRTILINTGRIVRDGRTEEILKNQQLLEENGLELPLSLSRP